MDNTWDLTTPTDLTSPLNIFKSGGDCFFPHLLALSLMYELYLLFKEDALHFQFVPYIVIVVLLVLVCLGIKIFYWLFKDIALFFISIIYIPLIEAIFFFSPFHCYRERASKYRELCQSAPIKCSTMFRKLIWYPLCYTFVYTLPVVLCCVYAPLGLLNHETTLLSLLLSLLPNFVRWVIDWILIDSFLSLTTVCYIPTAIYLNFKDLY